MYVCMYVHILPPQTLPTHWQIDPVMEYENQNHKLSWSKRPSLHGCFHRQYQIIYMAENLILEQ